MSSTRIGFLATGSEIINGEILNVDAQKMAQQMLEHGITVGEHVVTDDHYDNLRAGFEFLLQRHDAVITTGGLGPTSDDITRNIIADVTGQELKFDEASWHHILDRFKERDIPITDNNKQQCYFPASASVITNINGSANACFLEHHGKLIFMLPGPPRECIPIFEAEVLPRLLKAGFGSNLQLYRWKLMGIGESTIAEQLEAKVGQPMKVEIAYRASFPYCDIKLMLDKTQDNSKISNAISNIVKPYLVSTDGEMASFHLKQHIVKQKQHIYIFDQATRGALEKALMSPETQKYLHFVESQVQDKPFIHLNEFKAYWESSSDKTTAPFSVMIDTEIYQANPPLRGEETLNFSVEFTCHHINQQIFGAIS